MDGSSFVFSGLREVCIERGNPLFRVTGRFVVDFEGIRIVRYFDNGTEATSPSKIETLGSGSFLPATSQRSGSNQRQNFR
jgi:hypothetical protein